MSAVTVFPADEEEEETLAEAIHSLSAGIKKVQSIGINEKAVMVLLKHHTGMAMRDIRIVLEGMATLEELYCED